MKKAVIGLNIKYFTRAVVFGILQFICLFLPYVNIEGSKHNFFHMTSMLIHTEGGSKLNVAVYGTIVFTILSFGFVVVNLISKSKVKVQIWQCLQAINTVAITVLLFSTKTIVEKAGLARGFLNKDLGLGYYGGFIFAFLTLIFVMKLNETNTGYIVLTIMGIIWMFPILWILLTALRAEQGYYVGYFFPKGLTLSNFTKLFAKDSVIPFGKWWVNTFIVAICGCVLNTLIILATSFTLSRTRFAGRKAFMNVLMIIGLFPGFMSLIAVYNILKGIGLNQSLVALIIVSAAGAAMGYHVSKGFFDTIPRAVDEAAIIDGASRLQIFTHITLPLSKSIIVYTALVNFLAAWSDYIFPSMLFGDKQSSYTVAVGLYWLTDFRRIDRYYTQFAAGAVIVAIPIVILFIWLQKFYVEGLSGSVKG
ncbi:arabinogalactan oligomer / maltooligosaccharide transport system permease protein [Pseudobutyrivibrio sp. UC1225]|uniref:sugar ABC transporter permease n=1 Tax=Pseudobutyrivibrio sp. UC1225 TaxID=1798185 RepID=UPI0008E71E86|nr:ABC transporter permease subunit [Pseudobutyrivibrio sp. UC1225]SFN67693.1 arabinogalactan oligomer / maltooligosaccharide transport system permease protein [Pseudobutyrivibrio sp. UC1225]